MEGKHPELDTYEIKEDDQLGSGGFSTVYRAWHKRLKKDVVIKRIFREMNGEVDVRADADNLKNLHHTYLPQVYDYIEADGESIIVMDYIPGKTLEKCMEDGMRMKQKDIIQWGIQLCSAVEYLHSRKPPMIHSDIKPANVMLRPDGTICLIDFNIASTKGEKGAKVIGCSKGYSPPEQYVYYEEEKRTGSASDSAKAKAGGMRQAQSGHYAGDREDGRGETIPLIREDSGKGTLPPGREADGKGTLPLSREDSGQETLPLSREDNGQGTRLLNREDGGNETLTLNREDGGKETLPPGREEGGQGTQLLDRGENGDVTGTRPLSRREREALEEAAPAKEVFRYALVDERSDLYSIGATLYHLVMGIVPAERPEDVVPLEQSSVRITDGLIYTIQKAMQAKPEKRFKSAMQMKKSLENVVRINRAYKRVVHMQEIAVICLVLLFGGFLLMNRYGSRVMAEEKEIAYEESLESLADSREAVGGEDYQALYEEAISYYPERTAPYYEMTYALYLSGDYEEVIRYVEEEVLSRYDLEYGTEMADIYFLEANAYFELERYEEAIPRFAQAIYLNHENVEYYRDYAISLARVGDESGAAEVLAKAEELNLADDSVYLIRGEIELERGNLTGALEHLSQCIDAAGDDYMKMRAALVLSELYDVRKEELLSTADEEYLSVLKSQIALLEEMILSIAQEYTPALRERLVQAYLDASAYTEDPEYDRLAADTLEGLVSLNWDSYSTHNNLAILYQKLDEHGKAAEELNRMLEDYGEDYNIYKRFAFLELDIQSEKANEERDYAQFLAYYERAKELYDESSGSNRTDAEMTVLDDAVASLQRGGWL